MEETVGYLEQRREFEKDGLTFAVFFCRLPIPVGEEKGKRKIAALYRSLAERFYEYVKGELYPYVLAAYEKNEDPRRRFTLRPATLELTGEVSSLEGGLFSVLRRVKIRCGRTRGERVFGETFALSDGALLSPRAFVRSDKALRRAAKGACGFVLKAGSLTLFYPDFTKRDFPFTLKKE